MPVIDLKKKLVNAHLFCKNKRAAKIATHYIICILWIFAFGPLYKLRIVTNRVTQYHNLHFSHVILLMPHTISCNGTINQKIR